LINNSLISIPKASGHKAFNTNSAKPDYGFAVLYSVSARNQHVSKMEFCEFGEGKYHLSIIPVRVISKPMYLLFTPYNGNIALDSARRGGEGAFRSPLKHIAVFDGVHGADGV
jgi:hypothetical protein